MQIAISKLIKHGIVKIWAKVKEGFEIYWEEHYLSNCLIFSKYTTLFLVKSFVPLNVIRIIV